MPEWKEIVQSKYSTDTIFMANQIDGFAFQFNDILQGALQALDKATKSNAEIEKNAITTIIQFFKEGITGKDSANKELTTGANEISDFFASNNMPIHLNSISGADIAAKRLITIDAMDLMLLGLLEKAPAFQSKFTSQDTPEGKLEKGLNHLKLLGWDKEEAKQALNERFPPITGNSTPPKSMSEMVERAIQQTAAPTQNPTGIPTLLATTGAPTAAPNGLGGSFFANIIIAREAEELRDLPLQRGNITNPITTLPDITNTGATPPTNQDRRGRGNPITRFISRLLTTNRNQPAPTARPTFAESVVRQNLREERGRGQ